MRRLRRAGVLVTTLLLATAGSAFAQESRTEFSAGWRLLHIQETDGEEDGLNFPKGWYADVAVHMNDMFSIVGDVSGNYKNLTETETISGITTTAEADFTIHTFMGGVRFRASQNPRVVPFGQVLFGGVRASVDIKATTTIGGQTITLIDESESGSEAAFSLGGGVNISAGSIGVRAYGDWLKVIEEDSGNAFRFGLGIVIPF